jgi:DNA-binding LytR/AlgR family response regulator
MRLLLVDDEQPARERLRRLLQAIDDVEIVGEAEDGEQAMERIVDLKPDVVLLDIQMPGCGGIEVAASLPSPRPRIIFCTAYEQYAVDAFELHAVDYLLKPVNRARLATALDHVRQLPAAEVEAAIEKAGRLARKTPTRFLARHGSKFRVVPVDHVVCFVSEGGLTKLETAGHHCWMQPSLTELTQRLDDEVFCRISRAAIVRLDAVREVLPSSGGSGEVVLNNGTQLEISRRRFKQLLEKLAG